MIEHSARFQAYITHQFKRVLARVNPFFSGRCLRFIINTLVSIGIFLLVMHFSSIILYKGYVHLIKTTAPATDTDTETTPDFPPTMTTAKPVPKIKGITNTTFMFIDVSGRPDLTLRQLCSMESVARLHKTRKVVAALTNEFPITSFGPVNKLMRVYHNIRIETLDIRRWLEDTSMRYILNGGHLQSAYFRKNNLRDVLTTLVALEYGAFMIDFGMIALDSIDGAVNVVGLQEYSSSGAAFEVIALQKGHPVLKNLRDIMTEEFEGLTFGGSGGILLSKAIMKYCKQYQNRMLDVLLPGLHCPGIGFLSKETFYPISKHNWRLLFRESKLNESIELLRNSYAVNTWLDVTEKQPIFLDGRKHAMALLMKKRCPVVVRLMISS